MSRNPFWDEVDEPTAAEPVNPFLYPERLEALVPHVEPEPPKKPRAVLRLPQKGKP